MMNEADRLLIPKYFFITTGKAISKVSKLNAFDRALINAGLGDCNLVRVSSIIPPNAKLIEPIELPIGSIVFVVMARMDGDPNEDISAGIAWAWIRSDSEGKEFGVIVEDHGNEEKEALIEKLKMMCIDMAEARGMVIKDIRVKVEEMHVPEDHYGSVIAIAVLLPETIFLKKALGRKTL